MPKYALSFINMKDPMFMQGTNLGNKISTSTKPIKLALDDERQIVWVSFKDKTSAVPLTNIVSMDFVETPKDITDLLAVQAQPKPSTVQAAPTSPRLDPNDPPRMPMQAQVSNPTQPAQGLTGVAGKKKAISHAELNAQMEAEKLQS